MTRRLAAFVIALVLAAGLWPAAAGGGLASISADEMSQWLAQVSSDEMQGRAIYSSGLGLAAGYIQDHLRRCNIRPAGDAGYLQTVRVLSVRATSRSTVTVQVGRESRTFTDGEGVMLPRCQGGKQRVVASRVEFVGYGLDVPAAGHFDYRGKDVKDAAVVYLGAAGPKGLDSSTYRQLLTGRSR